MMKMFQVSERISGFKNGHRSSFYWQTGWSIILQADWMIKMLQVFERISDFMNGCRGSFCQKTGWLRFCKLLR